MLNKRRLPSMTALQCFEAVARHLSFTRAAEELSLTQSAMSKQVAQLEEQLQHALFRRVRKRLQLTPAGELYLAEVRRILQQVELSTRFLLSYGGETEVLRVATPPTFGARWLIPQLNGWRHRHPNIHLDLRQELEPDDLRQGHCDLAFFFGPGTCRAPSASACSANNWWRSARHPCCRPADWTNRPNWRGWCCCRTPAARRPGTTGSPAWSEIARVATTVHASTPSTCASAPPRPVAG